MLLGASEESMEVAWVGGTQCGQTRKPRVETLLTWNCYGGHLALVNEEEVSVFPQNDVDISAFRMGVQGEWAARRGLPREMDEEPTRICLFSGTCVLLCPPTSP